MKKIIVSFFALLLIAGSAYCQGTIDVAKEEEAIKAMLKKEVDLFWERDFDAPSRSWMGYYIY